MAKLNRERRLRERRMEKKVKKDLRKRDAEEHRRRLAAGEVVEAEPEGPADPAADPADPAADPADRAD